MYIFLLDLARRICDKGWMKTAIELLGSEQRYQGLCGQADRDGCDLCREYLADIELVARRAREEAIDAAAREADYFAANSSTARHIARAIRALLVAPGPK